jgi:hypothetical protein
LLHSGSLRAQARQRQHGGREQSGGAGKVGGARIDRGVQRAADQRPCGAGQRGGRLQRAQRDALGAGGGANAGSDGVVRPLPSAIRPAEV